MYLTPRIKYYPAHKGHSFLANAITGEILLISAAGRRAIDEIRSGSISSTTEKFIPLLRSKKFIFESKDEEERCFHHEYNQSWEAYRSKAPSHFIFIVNTHCNFACPYCFEQELARQRNVTLTPEQVLAAFQVIKQHIQTNPAEEKPSFELFGGEPLLPASETIISKLLHNIGSLDCSASIQTNGYYLRRYFEIIKTYQNSIGSIQITLDGPKNIHDRRRVPVDGSPTFEHLVTVIEDFLELRLPITLSLRTNVDKENAESLREMADFYEKKGWTKNPNVRFVAAPVDNRCGKLQQVSSLLSWDQTFKMVFPLSTDTGGGPFDISVFKPISHFRDYFYSLSNENQTQRHFVPKVIYCEAAALKLFAFHPDSRIYPCPETVGRTELAIGTYFPEFSFIEEKAENWKKLTILEREGCTHCEISTFCGGGCVLAALMQKGSMERPVCDDACEVVEAYFEQIRSVV